MTHVSLKRMNDLEIIVVAPIGRDAQLICDLLARVGLQSSQFPDCHQACREAAVGVGAFVIADEVLDAANTAVLAALISRQPPWSDLPVIVLTDGGQVTRLSESRRKSREPLGNVVLVERPVRPETLVSTMLSAIRARSRQYEVRDHLRHERLAAEALRRSEKLAVAGRLAASIAHEINNPLEAVINLHFLMSSAASLEESQRYLSIADQELARVIDITTQTLRFHRETTTPAEVDVTDVMESVVKLYERRIAAANVVVERRMSTSALITGFAGELRQVFANLISNALDAMPQGGKLYLRVQAHPEHRNPQRRGVRVVVCDNGSGIPVAIRHKVLEPFVSTKDDKGTGLGLWVSSEIVRKHRGTMRFKSWPGRGTLFSIFLPLDMARPATDDVSALAPGLARTGS